MSELPPSDVCFMCREVLGEGTVTVKKRGIQTLIKVSQKRGLEGNMRFLCNLNEVTVHDACRKRYTVESNVKASVQRGGDVSSAQPSASRGERLRSASGSRRHIIGDCCFLCGEKFSKEYF